MTNTSSIYCFTSDCIGFLAISSNLIVNYCQISQNEGCVNINKMFCLPRMYHNCRIKNIQGSIPELFISGNIFQKLKTRLRRIVIISSDNPRASGYFKSERALRDEKQRQLNSKCPWIIHPLGKLRAWYEIYLILLYVIVLISKPIDSAFARQSKELFVGYRMLTYVLDVLCWFDIFVNFCTGFACDKMYRFEIRPSKIAKHYMLSIFFICDVLSSIPRNLPYLFFKTRALLGLVPIFALLKIIRLITVIGLINNAAQYFQIRSRGIIFIITSTLVTFLIVHWISCLQFLIPRLTGTYFYTVAAYNESWIFANGLFYNSLRARYTHSFFKGSAEILGIRLPLYEITLMEDYLVSISTFVMGRILLAAIWIILAMTFLNARSMEIKFTEIINQLDEYMAQKNLPFDLRKRIIRYYNFKYQKKYFKDAMITNMLSSNLKKEVNMQICRSLILNVSLFSDLTVEETGVVVTKLTPEIFLSKDTVIHSGTASDTLYFISSGTVAVYTRSGQEVCHLQDGGYFGEICLVMKNYSSQISVVAIEITHIYKLKKRYFDQCFLTRKDIYQKVIKQANARMKLIMKIEEEYQNEKLKGSLKRLQKTVSNNGDELPRK